MGVIDEIFGVISLKESIQEYLIHIQQSLDNFNFDRLKPGLAVEFGSGNSIMVSELLKKGWKVEAVDNSQRVLTHLQHRIGQTVAEKMDNLTLVCADMETYQFPNDAKFIVAKDSLPYCNPDKVVEVWDKAYESLEEGGRIAGNFFPRPCNQDGGSPTKRNDGCMVHR